ncbi:hypothetical protein BH23PSE1_BH23PSE1_08190 [soil metagenome]
MPDPIIAYCGPAAIPETFWLDWNLDPPLLAALLGFGALIAAGRTAAPRAASAALAILILVLVSPLCALSSALFSARVLHHVLLVAVVAPLLALALPARRLPIGPIGLLVGLHAAVLWTWHAPGPYTWGLASLPAYWLMQASLIASAWALWRAVLDPRAERMAALLALVATIAQMGMLGALITFAPQPLYLVHLASTGPWGLAPLADQQLAGLTMWVPAILPYLGVGLWLAYSSLRAEPAR